jgi:hypothetical protein
MFFPPWPDDDTRPEPAVPVDLGVDDDWSLAPAMGPLFKIFQQDSLNLPKVQRGLKYQEQQEVIFASYGEAKIRHFWQNLNAWLEIGETDVEIRA